jgi:hypothetical protein
MKKNNLFPIFILFFVIVYLFVLSVASLAQEQELPQLELPVVATTAGQSPGALMFSVIAKKAQIPCDREDLLTAQMLKDKAEAGEPYKTLVITTGTSMKGMGAAGVNIDAELKRIEEVIAEAKAQNITIIGSHIEGPARRVDETDAASINAVIPESDIILVRNDSNEDGYFTDAAEELDVPLIAYEKTTDLGNILAEMFGSVSE